MGLIVGKITLFANIITNYGHFEMKLGHYMYFHGIYKKIDGFFQTWLYLLQNSGQRMSKYG